jgi:RNA 3'-terminal phosphate cyclase (ATP)
LSRFWEPNRVSAAKSSGPELVTLDGSQGEGGGQILRTSLTLSLLTGRPFRIVKIRANRENPGLRAQHLSAVKAAATLGNAEVTGATVGSRDLTFRPSEHTPRDLNFDIGTAGSTALVLHTLYLPLALRAEKPLRLSLSGGTFNTSAPSFPFLEATWRRYLDTLGMSVGLTMPRAGFFPKGAGQLEVWVEPANPRATSLLERGALKSITGIAGTSNLPHGDIAKRMSRRAQYRLSDRFPSVAFSETTWPSIGQGAAMVLIATYEHMTSTFVGLGARGKPAEAVADEAVDELIAFEVTLGAVDPHSADQLLLPLALAPGRSEYTTTEVTEHLRTNIQTIRAFLDRDIRLDHAPETPPRVIIA